MRFHVAHRHTTRKPFTSTRVQALGLRVGYWPCLQAPFVQVTVGSHIFEVWFGLESYRKPGMKTPVKGLYQ